MRKLFMIVLCTALAFVTVNAFGQKPTKPSKQVKPTTATLSQKPTAKPSGTTATEKCWEITDKNNNVIEYRWDTEANVNQWINEMRTQHNEIYSYTSCNHKTMDACDANNEKCQPKKCWKITGTKSGQGYEQYLWSTETVARRKTASLRSNGYLQVKYEETPANDEKSCHAPTTNTNPNEATCWKITIGNTVTYLWGYEQDVQATVNDARNSGQTASYELTPNKTKDSCY